MRKDALKFFVLGGAMVLGGLAAVAVGDLIAFQPNTPIKSADVNSNFSTLRSAIQALEAPINTARLADGSVTLPKLSAGGTLADGKVLKAQGGALVWGDDLTGGGGTAYMAGAGLSLSSATFSVANGGVTGAMLANGAVSGGKIALPLTLTGAPGAGNVLQVNSSTTLLYEGAIQGSNSGAGQGLRGISAAGSGVYGQTNGTGSSAAGLQGQAIGTGTGVVASSTEGTGLYAASFSGSALEVEGPIRVRGSAARRAAFIHVATAGNVRDGFSTSGKTCTGLSDSSAIVQATRNLTSSTGAAVTTPMPAPIGVQFDPAVSRWCIYWENSSTAVSMVGYAFNVTVIYSAP